MRVKSLEVSQLPCAYLCESCTSRRYSHQSLESAHQQKSPQRAPLTTMVSQVPPPLSPPAPQIAQMYGCSHVTSLFTLCFLALGLCPGRSCSGHACQVHASLSVRTPSQKAMHRLLCAHVHATIRPHGLAHPCPTPNQPAHFTPLCTDLHEPMLPFAQAPGPPRASQMLRRPPCQTPSSPACRAQLAWTASRPSLTSPRCAAPHACAVHLLADHLALLRLSQCLCHAAVALMLHPALCMEDFGGSHACRSTSV